MSFEPVDFTVLDSTDAALPVAGVLIKIYNPAGTVFYTQATTDAAGVASFLLETQSYSARFYKSLVSFQQPQLFTVLASPETNSFDVTGEVFVPPIATSPRWCRASGYFITITGGPQVGLDMHFLNRFAPVLVEGMAVITAKDAIRTDTSGYAEIDLLRGGEYTVTVQGMEDVVRTVRVPDAASVNLPDLLFPVVKSVALPGGPLSLSVGSTLEVVPVVMSTDGRQLSPATAVYDVRWSVEDASIAVVTWDNDKLYVKGLAAGTTNLIATRLDQSIVRIPNTAIEGQPVEIVVT